MIKLKSMAGEFYLKDVRSLDSIKELFIERWNWENPCNSSVFFTFPDELNNKIVETLIIAEKLDFKIFLFSIKDLQNPEKELKGLERKIITTPDVRRYIENAIFIFSTYNFDYLDFVKAEKIGKTLRLKRFSITPENRDKLRTPCEQLDKLKLNNSPTFTLITNQIEEAFSVESVTEKFYEQYIEIFEKIKKCLKKQDINVEEKEKKLRDFIHQVLNRIMFLYFVQKRGCFGNDKNFLSHFWDAYKTQKNGTKFHKDWLNVLFFESLSQPSWLYQEKTYLGKFNDVLKFAPYLNGGLFERNELDDIGWEISDNLFDDIFEFFESYNFTIEESTPLDIDIAINPEMLGNIYEHLVSVEELKERQKLGIFYTPKVEIDLMIRRALVEFLWNKTKIDKEKLYKFIFKEIENEIEYPFDKQEAEKVLEELDRILILDPACGSGHYLVVAVQTLYDLKRVLWEKLGRDKGSKYDEKKKIIERNIFGNDIKGWAVNIAKLRLWLDLFIDAEDYILKDQHQPLLPNLGFKIRCGDSLVQRIGNELVPLRNVENLIKKRKNDLKFLIKFLIQKREEVYRSGNTQEYQHTIYLERKILLDTLGAEKIEIKKKIQEIDASKKEKVRSFWEKESEENKILFEKEFMKRKQELENELNSINELIENLEKSKDPPFLWDLAFIEVFEMKKGFDIVIANPPYVRQEIISDPSGYYSKTEYKNKLEEQLIKDYSINFDGKNAYRGEEIINIDKRSDLYLYFYLKGLKLLNPDGILCFISSNSWLDVEFGTKFQKFLLKRVPIVAIYDNQVKRSFKQADINTIIALMKGPQEPEKIEGFGEGAEKNEVKFVMFKKEFEEIMYSDVFIDIEKDYGLKELPEGKRRETEDYRLHIVNQKDLYKFGCEQKTGEYVGNKWGGKYLRAPEIYWTILEKGKGKLVRLGDIAEVRFGIKTGANEFFYLKPVDKTVKEVVEIAKENPNALIKVQNGAGWIGEIEVEFLKPVIKSPRELKTILVRLEDLNYLVFMCNKSKEELKGTKALEYIEWGEKEKYHKRPSCKSRQGWWDLGEWKISKSILPMFENERKYCFYNASNVYIDASLYWCYPKISLDEKLLNLLLNSTLIGLWKELLCRSPEGLGALQMKVYHYSEMPIPSIENLNNTDKTVFEIFIDKKIYSIFTELGFDPDKPIRDQEPNPLPDRKALDDIVFDALGLTEGERKEVYWAVAELVQNRLKKAQSV